MDLFRLAWKNLWRNRRRTIITLIALSVSVLLVQAAHNLAIGVYDQMIASGVRAGSGHIALYRGDFERSRDEKLSWPLGDLQARVAGLDGVANVLPRVYLPGLAQSSRESRGILLTGVDPAAEQKVNPFLRKLPAEKMVRTTGGRDAVIGLRLLRELQLKEGGKFVVTVQDRSGELTSELFRVRGVVKTGIKDIDGSLVMVGRKRAAAMMGAPGEIHELAVILTDRDRERPVFTSLEKMVRDRNDLRPVTWDEAMPNLANAIKLDYASQKFIFSIILLIVTIGVINTLLMSVMERTREFGVILALGAGPGRLRRMVLAEALVLGVIAFVLGTALGSLVTWYLVEVGIDLRRFVPENMEFGGVVFDPVLRATWDLSWMAQIALYIVGLCLVASLYPAGKVARLEPVEAMRHY
jgi:ABC-type lipoprotein release transport system permease subunit